MVDISDKTKISLRHQSLNLELDSIINKIPQTADLKNGRKESTNPENSHKNPIVSNESVYSPSSRGETLAYEESSVFQTDRVHSNIERMSMVNEDFRSSELRREDSTIECSYSEIISLSQKISSFLKLFEENITKSFEMKLGSVSFKINVSPGTVVLVEKEQILDSFTQSLEADMQLRFNEINEKFLFVNEDIGEDRYSHLVGKLKNKSWVQIMNCIKDFSFDMYVKETTLEQEKLKYEKLNRSLCTQMDKVKKKDRYLTKQIEFFMSKKKALEKMTVFFDQNASYLLDCVTTLI